MAQTKLSTKGQLIIPKDIRARHGWDAGTELVVEDVGHGVLVRELQPIEPTTVDDLLGCLEYHGPPKSLEDMERGIAEGAAESR